MSQCSPDSCRRKREQSTAFQTRAYAKKIAKHMSHKTGKKIEAFLCPHCGLYHLGKPNR